MTSELRSDLGSKFFVKWHTNQMKQAERNIEIFDREIICDL